MDVYARSAKAGRTVKRMDREGIIKGLEQFRADLKPFCGSHADWERFDAGLALLKEQEPHVLSLEEMIEAGKNHDAVYVEEGVGRCFWGLAVDGIAPPEDKPYNYPGGVLFNVVDACGDMWDGDFYLLCDVYPEKRPHPMGWRAWSAKPTEEQRQVVKWE